ncbi:oligosaccharide flippase family protein [Zavarzinella formosa]|uniref:oligosaccharide flippase family protein n=1 Tax=Zavarzinella formosa TaxID=360055 RepID=UPI00031B7CC9|nr:oligosaccharide flippase family protein [Zavarzinella formosa]
MDSPKPTRTTSRRTLIGGGAVLILGFGFDQIIRFGSNVILARLLDPHSFGVLALCMIFMVGLNLFSDLGLRTAIIQSKRGDEPAFLNTAWTIQVVRGFILWFAACGLAYPAAYWREKPETQLLWILPTIGFVAMFDGFMSTKIFTLHRHMGQLRSVKFDLTCQAFAVAVQLIWAFFDRSVNALVAGILASGTFRCFGSHLFLDGERNRFQWDKSAAKELAHFAGWIYVSTACWFLAAQTDKLVMGIRSLAALGVYNFAVQLVQMPVTLCGAISNRLLFPYYAQLVNGGKELREHFLNTHKMAGFLTGFFVTGAASAGPSLVRLIYDDRYQEAGLFIPMLAIGAFFQILDANGGALLNAKGWLKAYALSHFTKVVILAVGIPIGFAENGTNGMIVAIIIGDLVRYFVTCILLDRSGYRIFRTDVWWVLLAGGVYAMTILMAVGLREVIDPEHKKTLAALILATNVFGVCGMWLAIYLVGRKIGWLPHYRNTKDT